MAGPHDNHVRCWRCSKYLAKLLTRPWELVCPRCKAINTSHKVPLDNGMAIEQNCQHVANAGSAQG